jgi:hypothetical protein
VRWWGLFAVALAGSWAMGARADAPSAAELWAEFDRQVGAGLDAESLGEPLAVAGETLARIAERFPDDARLKDGDKRLAAARRDKTAALVEAGAEAVRGKDLRGAIRLLRAAVTLSPKHRAAAKALRAAEAKELARITGEAKAAAERGDLERTVLLLDEAAALAPGHKLVVAATKAAEKRLGAGQIEAYRADRRAQAERRARDTAASAYVARRDEQERAEAERRRKEEDARRAAEDARLRAEEAEQRRRAEEAAAEERRRRALESGTHTVRFELDGRYRDENLTYRIELPAACASKLETKRKPAACADCAIQLTYTVTAQCKDHSLTLVQDASDLAVTCTGRNCPQCEKLADALLRPIGKADGTKARVAASCWGEALAPAPASAP